MRPLTPPPHPSLGIWQAIIVPITPHTVNNCLKFLCSLPYLSHACRSRYAPSCPTLCDPVGCSPPGPLSMGFSRQESWSGLPFPSPGDLTDPGIKPMSLSSPALAGIFFTTGGISEAPRSR